MTEREQKFLCLGMLGGAVLALVILVAIGSLGI